MVQFYGKLLSQHNTNSTSDAKFLRNGVGNSFWMFERCNLFSAFDGWRRVIEEVGINGMEVGRVVFLSWLFRLTTSREEHLKIINLLICWNFCGRRWSVTYYSNPRTFLSREMRFYPTVNVVSRSLSSNIFIDANKKKNIKWMDSRRS